MSCFYSYDYWLYSITLKLLGAWMEASGMNLFALPILATSAVFEW